MYEESLNHSECICYRAYKIAQVTIWHIQLYVTHAIQMADGLNLLNTSRLD